MAGIRRQGSAPTWSTGDSSGGCPFASEKLPATLLLQVHDELLLEMEQAALPEALDSAGEMEGHLR